MDFFVHVSLLLLQCSKKFTKKIYIAHAFRVQCGVLSTCLTPVSAEALTAETLEASHSVAARSSVEALVTVD